MRVARVLVRNSATSPAVDHLPRRRAARPQKSSDRAIRSTLFTNVALAGLGVVTGILSARILGPSGEGEFAAIQTWPILLGTLATLGLDFSVVYYIAREPEDGRSLTSTATIMGFISSLIIGFCTWF